MAILCGAGLYSSQEPGFHPKGQLWLVFPLRFLLNLSLLLGWDYFQSLYYCFITLTTIGFGDFVALQQEHSLTRSPGYVVTRFILLNDGWEFGRFGWNFSSGVLLIIFQLLLSSLGAFCRRFLCEPSCPQVHDNLSGGGDNLKDRESESGRLKISSGATWGGRAERCRNQRGHSWWGGEILILILFLYLWNLYVVLSPLGELILNSITCIYARKHTTQVLASNGRGGGMYVNPLERVSSLQSTSTSKLCNTVLNFSLQDDLSVCSCTCYSARRTRTGARPKKSQVGAC